MIPFTNRPSLQGSIHRGCPLHAATGLTENRDIFRVSAKVGNIVMDHCNATTMSAFRHWQNSYIFSLNGEIR